MLSDQSDVEMSSALPKKVKKTPKSPTSELQKQGQKKLSTKEMIHKTLSASKSRKGISLYAIKKYMQENFDADIEKINYLIKKNIKESIEAGIIIQTKGVGASGSFRLAPESKQPKKPSKKPKKPKEATENEEKLEKPKKTSKNTDQDSKPKKTVAKNATTSKPAKADTEESKQPKIPSKQPKLSSKQPKLSSKQPKLSSSKENPKAGASTMKTSKKKSRNSMMKRRSIGSIIKPPKMKPAKVN